MFILLKVKNLVNFNKKLRFSAATKFSTIWQEGDHGAAWGNFPYCPIKTSLNCLFSIDLKILFHVFALFALMMTL